VITFITLYYLIDQENNKYNEEDEHSINSKPDTANEYSVDSDFNLNPDLHTSKEQTKPVKKGVLSEERVKLITSAEKYIQKIAQKHPSKAIEKSVGEARKILERVKGSAKAAAQVL